MSQIISLDDDEKGVDTIDTLGGTQDKAASPDADLILLCDAYMRALDAYCDRAPWLGADGQPVSLSEDEQDALLRQIERDLQGRQATTLEGLAAKARVVMFQAKQPDGTMEFSPSFTGDWPEQVVRDLLRMMEGMP